MTNEGEIETIDMRFFFRAYLVGNDKSFQGQTKTLKPSIWVGFMKVKERKRERDIYMNEIGNITRWILSGVVRAVG